MSALLAFTAAWAEPLRLRVTGSDDQPTWARLEVRDADGQMHQPPAALRDRSARNRPGGQPWYLGSFVSEGEASLDLPAGSYTVVAERGPEYRRWEETVNVSDGQPTLVEVRVEPWIRMNELGWWSADFHVHRPPDEAQKLLLAEDLNLGVVFTM